MKLLILLSNNPPPKCSGRVVELDLEHEFGCLTNLSWLIQLDLHCDKGATDETFNYRGMKSIDDNSFLFFLSLEIVVQFGSAS